MFAWLRPNDLIWNYWVSNYLMGKTPPAFDILFWNADATNLPAALHRDFLELALDNSLTKPGAATVLGTPIDLSKITVDSYVVAGIADHITPWQNAYRTANLLGSDPRFVLSTSGHIAALVNPPGNEKASFRINDELPEEPEAWLKSASTDAGLVVGRLDGVAGRALGRAAQGPQAARRQGLPAARRGARKLRARSRRVPRVRVNGVPLHYERGGSGEPLLLITGFTISSAVFEPVLELYGGRFDCITYDNRGSGPLGRAAEAHLDGGAGGGRGRPAAGDRGRERARVRALDGRDDRPGARDPLPRAGARTGARRHDARRPARGAADAEASSARSGARRPAAGATGSARGWASGSSPTSSGASSPSGRGSCCATSAAIARRPRACGRTGGRPSTTTRPRGSASIRAPTLVMHGERDAMAPISNARLLADRIPDAELCIVPGSGHAYMLERPQESFELLTAWLDRRGPIPAGAPRTGAAARAEPLTRALGLPIGAARTGASLAGMTLDKLRRRDRHVAPHR